MNLLICFYSHSLWLLYVASKCLPDSWDGFEKSEKVYYENRVNKQLNNQIKISSFTTTIEQVTLLLIYCLYITVDSLYSM